MLGCHLDSWGCTFCYIEGWLHLGESVARSGEHGAGYPSAGALGKGTTAKTCCCGPSVGGDTTHDKGWVAMSIAASLASCSCQYVLCRAGHLARRAGTFRGVRCLLRILSIGGAQRKRLITPNLQCWVTELLKVARA